MATPHGEGEQAIWVTNSALTRFPHRALRSFSSCVLTMTHTFYPNHPDKSQSVLLQTRHVTLDWERKHMDGEPVQQGSQVGCGGEGKEGERSWSWWTLNPAAKRSKHVNFSDWKHTELTYVGAYQCLCTIIHVRVLWLSCTEDKEYN